jgi:hypothetical protein
MSWQICILWGAVESRESLSYIYMSLLILSWNTVVPYFFACRKTSFSAKFALHFHSRSRGCNSTLLSWRVWHYSHKLLFWNHVFSEDERRKIANVMCSRSKVKSLNNLISWCWKVLHVKWPAFVCVCVFVVFYFLFLRRKLTNKSNSKYPKHKNIFHI